MYRVLLVLVFLSLILDGVSFFTQGTSLNLYPVLVMPIIILSIINNIRTNGIGLIKPILYFILFIFSVYFSLIYNDIANNNSLNLLANLKSTLSYTFWPLTFLLAITQKNYEKNLPKIMGAINIIGYIIAINCLLPIFVYFVFGITLGEFLIYQGKFRSFGFLSDQVGFTLVYFLINALSKRRYLSYLLFAISILATGTRGAIFVAIIGSIYVYLYIVLKQKYTYVNVIRNVLIISFFGVVLYSDLLSIITDNMLLRFEKTSMENATNQRLGAMRAGVLIFLNNPVFGVGIGNYTDLVANNSDYLNYFNYLAKGIDAERGFANAQNEFVNIIVNGGIVSLAFVVSFLYYSIKNLQNNIRYSIYSNEYRIILIFILLMLLFDQSATYMFNYGINSFMFLTLLGIGSSISKFSMVKIN